MTAQPATLTARVVAQDLQPATLTVSAAILTAGYNLTDLVYYEKIEGMDECIAREKQLKNWHRDWKINLIEVDNPKMVDLARDWYIMKDGVWLVRSSPLTDPETSSG